MLIFVSLLTGLISYYISSIFKRGIYFFLIFFGFVILNVEILSLFKGISGENILILTLIEFLICHFIWIKKNKPLLKIDFTGFISNLKESYKKDKSLLILSIALIFMLIISLILCTISPPNEADAVSYHALRALFWTKEGFIHHFETADIRCHCMPVNSEIFYTWVLSLGKNDCILGLLEYFSYFVLIISSFKIMEIINIDFNKRIWAILIFSSFAGVISQISSTQTDLVIGSLFCLSLYLFLEYKRERKINLLYFSSLCLAISFGTKSTGVIGSVPLIIYYLVELRNDIKGFIKFFLFLILNFVVFSSYNYVLNFVNYGNMLGSSVIINEHKLKGGLFGVISNLIKHFLYIFDFSSLSLFYLLSWLYETMVRNLFNFLHLDILLNSNGEIPKLNASLSEQITGLGILGFMVLLPCFIKSLLNKNLKRFSLIFIFQFILLSSTIIYFPTSIRFFISYICLLIPSLTLFYDGKIYKKIIVIIALFYLIHTPLFLVQRPFINLKNHLFDKNLLDNIRDVRYDFYLISKKQTYLKDEIKPLCGNNKRLGFYFNDSFMGYTIKHLDLENNCKIDFLTLDKNTVFKNYDYLIIENSSQKISTIKDTAEILNKNKLCKTMYANNYAMGKICFVNDLYFIENNFIPDKKIIYKADVFLKKTGNDEDTIFYVFKKE